MRPGRYHGVTVDQGQRDGDTEGERQRERKTERQRERQRERERERDRDVYRVYRAGELWLSHRSWGSSRLTIASAVDLHLIPTGCSPGPHHPGDRRETEEGDRRAVD